jgi:hypothetical protein
MRPINQIEARLNYIPQRFFIIKDYRFLLVGQRSPNGGPDKPDSGLYYTILENMNKTIQSTNCMAGPLCEICSINDRSRCLVCSLAPNFYDDGQCSILATPTTGYYDQLDKVSNQTTIRHKCNYPCLDCTEEAQCTVCPSITHQITKFYNKQTCKCVSSYSVNSLCVPRCPKFYCKIKSFKLY